MGTAGAGNPAPLFEQAAVLARASGDSLTATKALLSLSLSQWYAFGSAASRETLDEAILLVEAEPPSAEMAQAYTRRAGNYMMAGQLEEQLEWSERGVRIAEEVDAQDQLGRSLSIRGIARVHLGDVEGGMADLRESVALAEATASVMRLHTSYVNLADHVWMVESPSAAMEIFERCIEVVEGRGGTAMWAKAETMWAHFDLGRWDEVLQTADVILEAEEADDPTQLTPWAHSYQGLVAAFRGPIADAAALRDVYLPALREIGDLQLLIPALVAAARTTLMEGDPGSARELLDELLAATEGKSPVYRGLQLTEVVRLLIAIGDMETAAATAGLETPWLRTQISQASAGAMVIEASGDAAGALARYEEVAQDWADYGFVLEQGFAHYGAGRSLAQLGRPDEAAQRFGEARALFATLGAQPTIEEIDGIADQAAAL